MTVDVREDGCIVVDDLLMADCTRYTSKEEDKPVLYKIELNLIFEKEEDARRYYNALNASVQVGCIHIHIEGGMAIGGVERRVN